MPNETVGDVEHVVTADHPVRTESDIYKASRKWLMSVPSGTCYVCGGPADMSHPEPPGDPKNQEDHHGGGIYLYQDGQPPILVGFNLFGLEWSLGWSASPETVNAYVKVLNEVVTRLGGKPYTAEIATTSDVMNYTDSIYNADVKLCHEHHVAHEDQHTPDVNGHEAVGIHNGPLPIWLGQATCDWERWDMWGGTTGTLCISPHGKGAHVLHVSPLHPDKKLYEEHQAHLADGTAHVLPSHNMHARLGHAGAHVNLRSQ